MDSIHVIALRVIRPTRSSAEIPLLHLCHGAERAVATKELKTEGWCGRNAGLGNGFQKSASLGPAF